MARYSIADTTLTALADATRKATNTANTVVYTSFETTNSEFIDFNFDSAKFVYKTEGVYGGWPQGNTWYYTVLHLPEGMDKFVCYGGESCEALYGEELWIAEGDQTGIENPETVIFRAPGTGGVQKMEFTTTATTLTIGSGVGWYTGGSQCCFYVDGYGPKKYTPEEMATEIDALQAIPADLLTWKGNCAYKNYGGAWDDFIEYFGDRITTKEVSSLNYGFMNAPLKKIPFEINFSNAIATDLSRAFNGCQHLEEAPIINNPKVNNTSYMFANCKNLREFPEDYGEDWDWSHLAETTSSYDGYCEQMFANCYSLRKLPMALYKYRNPKTGYRNTSLRNMEGLYALDEIIDFPYPYTETVTGTGSSSPFYYALRNCYRLKNFTFASDVGPKNWSNQTLDMTICVGWANYVNDCCSYNSGIDIFNHRVSDDASYQALKNDPNWFTGDVAYSRYNHDSAVATINSLPDCSAYQTANNKVANTIKFKGVAGEKTDGGAINTLTDEEIAVAAAKGWTVSIT